MGFKDIGVPHWKDGDNIHYPDYWEVKNNELVKRD